MNILTQNILPVMALSPADDAFAGTVHSRVLSMQNYRKFSFFVMCGVGATGTFKIQAAACDDFVPTTTSLIPFKVRLASNAGTPTDQFADVSSLADQDATAGYTAAAGSEKIIEVIVDARDLPAGFPNVRLDFTEVVDADVPGAVLAIGYQPYDRKPTMPTALS